MQRVITALITLTLALIPAVAKSQGGPQLPASLVTQLQQIVVDPMALTLLPSDAQASSFLGSATRPLADTEAAALMRVLRASEAERRGRLLTFQDAEEVDKMLPAFLHAHQVLIGALFQSYQ